MKTDQRQTEGKTGKKNTTVHKNMLTILQEEHFFTFLFSVQTTQQPLKSALERERKLLDFAFSDNGILTFQSKGGIF